MLNGWIYNYLLAFYNILRDKITTLNSYSMTRFCGPRPDCIALDQLTSTPWP